jgi:hypothetical protein
MFGLDWIAIIAAAIGGAIGGALGGVLSRFAKAGSLRTVLVVVPAIIGAGVVPPLIKPHLEEAIGPSVRTAQFDAVYETEIRPGLLKQPALARIFKDDPKAEDVFKAELRKAYQEGGAAGAVDAAAGIGARILGDHFVRYMPRARTEDLIEFAKVMGSVLESLNQKDSEGCVLFLFGTQHGKSLSTSRLKAAVGDQGMKAMLDINNKIVEHAADAAIPFDKARGETMTTEIAQRRGDLLTGKSSEVATGARLPADPQEAQAACAFSAALYGDIAALPPADAEAALRFMFT